MDHCFLTLIHGGCPLCAIQRLNAKRHEALSNFGFSFNLRRYTMGKWLRTLGNLTGEESVSRHLEIFWPSDNAFYGGTIAAYKAETGEHEVHYDDGGRG
jgi:hypothetical protein